MISRRHRSLCNFPLRGNAGAGIVSEDDGIDHGRGTESADRH